MKSVKNIKLMLLGIALMVLAIWCLVFGYLDDVTLFLLVGVYLPLPALVLVVLAFFFADEDTKKDGEQES